MTDTVHRIKQEVAALACSSNELLTQAANALLEAVEVNKSQQAYLDKIEDYSSPEFNPGWVAELRELAEKLRRIPPAIAITDEAHCDLCTAVATFLDTAFGEGTGEDALIDANGEPQMVPVETENPHSLISSALAKAEKNRDRHVTVRTEAVEDD